MSVSISFECIRDVMLCRRFDFGFDVADTFLVEMFDGSGDGRQGIANLRGLQDSNHVSETTVRV